MPRLSKLPPLARNFPNINRDPQLALLQSSQRFWSGRSVQRANWHQYSSLKEGLLASGHHDSAHSHVHSPLLPKPHPLPPLGVLRKARHLLFDLRREPRACLSCVRTTDQEIFR